MALDSAPATPPLLLLNVAPPFPVAGGSKKAAAELLQHTTSGLMTAGSTALAAAITDARVSPLWGSGSLPGASPMTMIVFFTPDRHGKLTARWMPFNTSSGVSHPPLTPRRLDRAPRMAL